MDEASHKKNFKPVILKDLFKDKNSSLARWIPGFIYRLLSSLLRIDFMNTILYHRGYKKNVDFARASIEVFNVSLEVKGRENLINEGRFIFVSNHPLGGFDGMMIISELCRTYKHLNVLVNELLMNVKNMDGIFVPINKHRAQATEDVRRINAIFESDVQVMSFPAGLVKEYAYSMADDHENRFSYLNS